MKNNIAEIQSFRAKIRKMTRDLDTLSGGLTAALKEVARLHGACADLSNKLGELTHKNDNVVVLRHADGTPTHAREDYPPCDMEHDPDLTPAA